MKKILLTLLAVAMLAVLLVSPALAAQLDNVTDAAVLLTDEQLATLEEMAENISDRYGCGVYVVTVDDYRELEDTDVQTCAEDLYDYFELGLGEERNGILLMLSMEERDYALIAYGQKAHYAFTDYGKEVLAGEFLDNFRNNDWYGGFYDYIERSGEMLALAESGTPVDDYSGDDYEEWHSEPSRADRVRMSVIIGLILGLIAAAITCGIFKRQMKNAVKATGAERYIAKENGMVMHDHFDRFTHQTVHRERIVREQRSGGGGHGGGTSINSHGFSGHSGKF